jgi:tetratricopeptide (TPR) repeat protein
MVRHWLEADGERRLLVFDNATDADVLRPYVPAGGAARVLITSNRQSVANLGTKVGVEVFTAGEALAFLADRTGLADAEGAEAVAAELGYLPLALAQAAAVIAGQHLTYGTYLERLRSLPVAEYLTREPGQPYPHGVAEAVLLALEALRADDQDGLCARVLAIMSALSAAGVRRDLVYAAGHAGALAPQETRVGANVVDRTLGQLAERSLLSFSLDGQVVIAHRLVLRVVREQLARQERLVAVCQAAASVLDARAKALADSPDRPAVRDIPEQVTALRDVVADLRAESGAELAGVMLGLLARALHHLIALGDSAQQAIVIGEPLIADQERVLGPGHPDTLASRNELARAYWVAGRTSEAIALNEQTLAARERVLGPDHPDTLSSANNLAITYAIAGRTDEAIALFEQTLAARERVLGLDHHDTVGSRNNLALAYRVAGRTSEAISLLERALAAYERVRGPDHPETLISRNNLALNYQEAGRTEEAIALHEQTLADRERVLGPGHPDTLQSQNNLALAYRDAAGQGRRSRCISGQWPLSSVSEARTTPTPWTRGMPWPRPTGRRAGRARRSPCTNGP